MFLKVLLRTLSKSLALPAFRPLIFPARSFVNDGVGREIDMKDHSSTNGQSSSSLNQMAESHSKISIPIEFSSWMIAYEMAFLVELFKPSQ